VNEPLRFEGAHHRLEIQLEQAVLQSTIEQPVPVLVLFGDRHLNARFIAGPGLARLARSLRQCLIESGIERRDTMLLRECRQADMGHRQHIGESGLLQ